MSDQFVAEIRIFPFNFPPRGWSFCDGQLLPISQNTALFSLLGTFYGGDGKSTFALPNLQGRATVTSGQGSGLSDYFIGQEEGVESVTLIQSEMPAHNHNVQASRALGLERGPAQQLVGAGTGVGMYAARAGTVNLAPTAIATVGASLPHNNLQPYLTLNYCIAMQGIFPPRG